MIDKIYINEAIRIRKEYLENISNVNKIELVYQELLEKLEKEKEKISKMDTDTVSQDEIIKYVKKLDSELNIIISKITPYTEKIKELDQKQRILYNTIKEKYVDITDEEIYNIIIPVIEDVDQNFDM